MKPRKTEKTKEICPTNGENACRPEQRGQRAGDGRAFEHVFQARDPGVDIVTQPDAFVEHPLGLGVDGGVEVIGEVAHGKGEHAAGDELPHLGVGQERGTGCGGGGRGRGADGRGIGGAADEVAVDGLEALHPKTLRVRSLLPRNVLVETGGA